MKSTDTKRHLLSDTDTCALRHAPSEFHLARHSVDALTSFLHTRIKKIRNSETCDPPQQCPNVREPANYWSSQWQVALLSILERFQRYVSLESYRCWHQQSSGIIT